MTLHMGCTHHACQATSGAEFEGIAMPVTTNCLMEQAAGDVQKDSAA